jgi:hypothetical protein
VLERELGNLLAILTAQSKDRFRMNISEIEMQLSDLVSEPLDKSEFVFKFMEIFNAPKAAITKLRKGTQNKADKPEDMLWQRKLYFRIAELGETEVALDALRKSKPTKTHKPRFIVSTDGKEFSALDTKVDETIHCEFDKLNDHFDFFLPLAGIDKYKAVEENPADIKAAGRLAKFYDEIVRHNPDWHTPEKRHALNQFMARVLFCLFSEDTGSFEKDLFVKTITEFGGDDGGQIQTLLKQVFDVMNAPNDNRENFPAHICTFPYVNGGLFAEQTEVPVFNKRAKRVLMEAARLDWREISPDIFGSMIQAIVDNDKRGDLGMHYTSVPNIMKVLHPLFIMSLEEELADAYGHREERARLKKLFTRLSKIRVFDPACGSGNFLIIAYRELRSLEIRIFQREDELNGGQIKHRWESHIVLSNFYGIELADFAAETAKLSLWIAEYQMNQRFKILFGESPPDFPLKEGGHIEHGNALRVNWLDACPPADNEEVETYIVGNPPYLGSSNQTAEQKNDMKHVFSPVTKNFKNLDYVAAWYLKGADYCAAYNSQCAFVATNSICQGEQVSLLWPLILSQGIEIGFAHLGFHWKNSAVNNAGVTCVIVGIRRISKSSKKLFFGISLKEVFNISPYLMEMDNIFVTRKSTPISNFQPMLKGNQPTDGGHLILSREEKSLLLNQFPSSAKFLRRLYGSKDFIQGLERWCLWIEDDDLETALNIDPIKSRIENVRKTRLSSKAPSTKSKANIAHKFIQIQDFGKEAIVVPEVSSERRQYIPCGFLDDSTIVTNKIFAIYNPPAYMLSIISSRMHMVWLAAVGGRMRKDYSYSNVLVYNNFPIPDLSEDQKQTLEEHVWEIIKARESHQGKTIAWLYDPDTIPADLLAEHQTLDDTLEKIYIGRPFKSDMERLEHLFKLYKEMIAKDKEAANV